MRSEKYSIRYDCHAFRHVRTKSNVNATELFHVLVTGGAGTGKCHLIKMMHYSATRILAWKLPKPDVFVLVTTAPAGVGGVINAATITQQILHRWRCQNTGQPSWRGKK